MIDNTVNFFDEMSQHPVYKNEMSDDVWWRLREEESKKESALQD